MNATYTVRGADGREYGPVSFEQITAWTREGRIRAQNEIRRNDMEHWAEAGDFIELKDLFPAPASSAPLAATPQSGGAAVGTVATPNPAARVAGRGASWFYWIAGLSVINAVISLTGAGIRFIFGLGITDIFNAIGKEGGGASQAVAFVLALVAAGAFFLLGVFAMKGHLWAFIVGIVLFALDAVVLLLFMDWLGVAFHAYVLFRLFQGMMAMRDLKAQSAVQV